MSLSKFFGLDIGNTNIKIVELKDVNGKQPRLVKAGSVETPLNTFGHTDDDAKKKLADAIRNAVEELDIDTKHVVAAVSERDVFSARIKFFYEDEKNDEEIQESAYWAISKVMPVPIDTVKYGYLPISVTQQEGRIQMDALVISVEKKISQHYLDILHLAKLEPLALETEGVALVRSISRSLPEENTQGSLILDIGSSNTSVCIVKGRNMVYSTSIQTGSEVMTRAICQAFALDAIQAEQYKKTYGLSEKFFEGKIANVIRPVLDSILIDVNRALQFFRQDQTDVNIQSIRIVGEAALMPNLIPYCTKYLGVETQVADPFYGINADKFDIDNRASYAVALGLALKTDFL